MAGLLENIAEEPSWRLDAQCRGTDNRLFFPETLAGTGKSRDKTNIENIAKAICHDCSVRLQCLDFALESNQPEGIWGGMTVRERKRIRKRERQAS